MRFRAQFISSLFEFHSPPTKPRRHSESSCKERVRRCRWLLCSPLFEQLARARKWLPESSGPCEGRWYRCTHLTPMLSSIPVEPAEARFQRSISPPQPLSSRLVREYASRNTATG